MRLESVEQLKGEGDVFPGVDVLAVVPPSACRCGKPRRLKHPTLLVGLEELKDLLKSLTSHCKMHQQELVDSNRYLLLMCEILWRSPKQIVSPV